MHPGWAENSISSDDALDWAAEVALVLGDQGIVPAQEALVVQEAPAGPALEADPPPQPWHLPDPVLTYRQRCNSTGLASEAFGPYLLAAKDLQQGEGASPPTAFHRLAEMFLSPQPRLHTSKAALSTLLQMSPQDIEPKLSILANAILHLESHSRHQLERALASCPSTKILYVDLNRMDETPLKLTSREALVTLLPPPTPPLEEGGMPAEPPAAPQRGDGLPQLRSTSTHKVFYSEQRFLLLLHSESGAAGAGHPFYIGIRGQSLTWNQLIERTTGQCQLQALLDVTEVSSASQAFPSRVRACTSDQHGANKKSERLLTEIRTEQVWQNLHVPCIVHRVGRALTNSFGLVEGAVSGMINVSLVLSTGAALRQFQLSLIALVKQRLRVVRGEPPLDVSEFHSFVLRRFCHTGTRQVERQTILSQLPSGDWRKRDVVEHYIPAGLDYNHAELEETICKGLILALASRQFHTYPRHRWTGCDIAVDQLTLLECVHGLGSATFLHMLGQGRGEAPHVDQPDVGAQALPLGDGVQQDTALPLEGEAGAAVEEPWTGPVRDPASSRAMPASQADDPASSTGNAGASAAENARRKAAALAFYQGDPWA